MPGQVPASVARERVKVLMALGEKKADAFAQSLVNSSVNVLVEHCTSDSGSGWSGEYVRTDIKGAGLRQGSVVSATVTRARNGELYAVT